MVFAQRTSISLFSPSRRRKSLAHDIHHETAEELVEETETLSTSASTPWTNPFGRNSITNDDADSTYHAPGSLPSSRRPSAATIISTLLHVVGVKEAPRVSQDSYGSSYEDLATSSGVPKGVRSSVATGSVGRRPSAILRAWKGRRGSQNTPQTPTAPTSQAQGGRRRKSFALGRVLDSHRAGGSVANGEDDSNNSSSGSDSHRRSLSIVCRGERDSSDLAASERDSYGAYEMDATPRPSGVTAAMAICDTWLYGSHQWRPDERKGSLAVIGSAPLHTVSAVGRKSISGPAVGLDMEASQLQREKLQERLKQLKSRRGVSEEGGDDAASVVSLSLTEEIALYTTDVEAKKSSAGVSGGNGARAVAAPAPFEWNLPDWGARATPAPATVPVTRLPMLSPAPAVMIADPFATMSAPPAAAAMQRTESGSVDPHMTPPSSAGLSITTHNTHPRSSISAGTQVQWNQPQWNLASPFRPDAPPLPSASVFAPHEDEYSPTTPTFPADARRRETAYYDASAMPVLAGSHVRDESEEIAPTPRLIPGELSDGGGAGSPLSCNFAPETPSDINAAFPPAVHDGIGKHREKEESGGDDLHEQFCSVLLLDLGDGRAIPLSPSPGTEPRPDPFALLAH